MSKFESRVPNSFIKKTDIRNIKHFHEQKICLIDSNRCKFKLKRESSVFKYNV